MGTAELGSGRNRVVVSLILCVLLLLPHGGANAAELAGGSADDCQPCHAQIYQEWQQSWMARAYVNDNFQRSFQRWQQLIEQNPAAVQANPMADPRRCLDCHAPLRRDDSEPDNPDGVTCQVCHTVRSARPSRSGHTLIFDGRGVIYSANPSPNRDAPHRLKYGSDLENSRLCAGCHQDRLPTGLYLERTYDEWLQSPYARQGIDCSDCHMPQTAGPATAGTDTKPTHASHRFAGGHSDSPLLARAATVRLQRNPDPRHITVSVTNASVGHNFPTGGAHPNKLILFFTLQNADGETVYEDSRIYQYRYLDANGRTVSPQQLQDSTLQPLETRREQFAIPESLDATKATARLEYHLIPDSLGRSLDPEIYETSYAPVTIDQDSLILK